MAFLSTSVKGDFTDTIAWLKKNKDLDTLIDRLKDYGEQGVEALSNATPRKTGLTASSWMYKIESTPTNIKISWTNSNLTKESIPVALLIQYGHGTPRGGYIQGIDYINPALKPIFEEIETNIWKEITEL